MNIPFFDLSRQYQELRPELESAVIDVMRSTQYIEGTAVQKLEQQLAEYIGVKHVVTCGNGTDALRIALQAAGVRPGDEVITTPFSFFATSEAIAQLGATPVFADIQSDTLNLDPECVEQKLTERTRAILPVHIFGLPADMDEINAIAAEKGIAVIEDACQAIGAVYRGKMVGTLGHAGCFSFYPTKNLGAAGDGGMITTNDDDAANAYRAIKAHGAGKAGAQALRYLNGTSTVEPVAKEATNLYDPYKYYNYLVGWNSRLDSVQAAVLSVKLKHLDQYNGRRKEIADRYTEAFQGLPVRIPGAAREDRCACYHQYALLCEEKESLSEYLAEKGIGTGAFYPVPIHRQAVFSCLGYGEGALPVSEKTCRESLCLPVFPELTEEEIDYIIDTVCGFWR